MEVEFFGMKFGITSYCWIFEPPLIVEWCELLLFPRSLDRKKTEGDFWPTSSSYTY